MAENIREIVLDTLLCLEKEETYSNKLIKAVMDKEADLSPQERTFLKRVTEGTIERQIELDYYINSVSSIPVKKMKPLIRNLLRMSLYQLKYMDSIPDSAVCNEACKLAEKRKFRNLKGFVNAILRKLAAGKDSVALPDSNKEPAYYYSVKYSMPGWIVEKWIDEYGEAVTEKLLQGLLEIHPVSLRFQDNKEADVLREQMKEKGVNLQESRYLPYLFFAENTESIDSLPGFTEGLFAVQDVSSALAVEAAGIQEQDFVVDACAAPGGKALFAAKKANRLLARDISEAKCSLIEENRARLGVENITIQVQDATVTDLELYNQADVLLLDVPCSGLGVIGKKRDIKYRVSQERMDELVELQRAILESCWQYVKPGGILLYSTCTINPEENEEMVQWILDNLPFEPDNIKDYIPESLYQDDLIRKKLQNKQEFSGNEDVDRCSLQLLPGFMEADGFFFARLRRKGDQ